VIAKCFAGNAQFAKALELHGNITVPPRPGRRDGKKPNKKTFSTWKRDFAGYLYQGELNNEGEYDGVGILIDPQKYLIIGHFIHGDK
jgi:hypothetical protein